MRFILKNVKGGGKSLSSNVLEFQQGRNYDSDKNSQRFYFVKGAHGVMSFVLKKMNNLHET